jgi:hypothetical protein
LKSYFILLQRQRINLLKNTNSEILTNGKLVTLDKLHLFQDSTLEAPTLLQQLEPKDMVQLMMLEHTTDQNHKDLEAEEI